MPPSKSVRKKAPRHTYSSKKASQSVSEIMSLLTEFGADSFHVQQSGGQVVAVAFETRGIVFQVAPNVEGVRRRLAELKRSDISDPHSVAWAQLRAWIELQLELIENGVISSTEAFAGYALTAGGRTVAAMLEERSGELMPGETRLLPPRGNA